MYGIKHFEKSDFWSIVSRLWLSVRLPKIIILMYKKLNFELMDPI
jgi:hypothetical protein